MDQLLAVNNVTKTFVQGETELMILKGITLGVGKGEFIIIHGPSGAGKSTLIHIIGLLDLPSSGEIIYNDINASALSDSERSFIRNSRLGFVFQMYHLLPEFDLTENVLLPSRVFGRPRPAARKRAERLLETLRLSHRANHPVTKLSGGEMQRACIARALINDPEVLLCDEPTGNLDANSANGVWELLKSINTEDNVTVIAVTHDERALKFGGRVIKIHDGMVVSQ